MQRKCIVLHVLPHVPPPVPPYLSLLFVYIHFTH